MNAASAHVRRTTSAPSLPAVAAASSSSSIHERRLDPLDNVPHTAGSGDCLCWSCHLKVYYFPRRQDGRIVLPDPSMTCRNQRLGGPQNAAPRVEREETQNQHMVQNLLVDRGEGTSNPSVQLSGPGVPAGPQVISLRPFFDFPDDTRQPKTEIHLASSHARIDKRPRSNTKPYQHRTSNKPYQHRTKPGPRFPNAPGNETRPRSRSTSLANTGAIRSHEHHPSAGADFQFSNPYAEISSHPTPSRAGGRLSWPDPYATIIEEPFSQLFNSPIGLGKRELNLSGSSTSLSQQTSFSGESEYQQKPSPSMTSTLSQSAMGSSYTRSPSTSQQPLGTSAVSQSDTGVTPSNLPRDLAMVPIENPPRVIRFNSRHNPQPAMWASRADVELDDDRSQERASPPNPQQTHNGMLQFQNPLIPESYPAIVTGSNTRELSVIHVKWDSERKRRQGYFAQEQGVEKSPFRHYNKTSCDFDQQ